VTPTFRSGSTRAPATNHYRELGKQMNDNAVVTIPPGVTTTIPGTDLQIHHNSAVTQSVTVSGGTVDPAASRYYIADRSNKGVDIFDTKT